MSRKLVELLHKERLLNDAQLQEADQLLRSGSDPVRHFLETKVLSESKLVYFLSQKFSLQSLNLSKFEIKPEVLASVSPELVRKTQSIPIQMGKGVLVVAVPDPTQLALLDDIRFATKMTVEAVLTTFGSFDQALIKYYGGNQGQRFGKEVDSFQAQEVNSADSGSSTPVDDAPVIAAVNGILSEAIKRGASDIHVEPYEKDFRVRLRIDGSLVDITHIPTEMKRAVVARFKMMSRMDASDSRTPQEGRIRIKIHGREVDFQINTLPTLFGEKVVARILNKGNLILDLKKIGFEEVQLEIFKKGIAATSGMILITGPIGSGKSTTLYSALMELNVISDNVYTIEDPVEHHLEGINQIQVNQDVGLTFATGLRALLKQDPDTVLIGEIRDFEIAELAVQAALTGRLVLSAFHTNDAIETITRLINMGCEPFSVTAALNTIVAQRLLRALCPQCKEPSEVPEHQLLSMGIKEKASGAVFYQAKGCKACNHSGYKGRVAIFEVFDFNSTLKEMILKKKTSIEIKREAITQFHLQTLRTSGLRKAMEGVTSLEEAISMTPDDQ